MGELVQKVSGGVDDAQVVPLLAGRSTRTSRWKYPDHRAPASLGWCADGKKRNRASTRGASHEPWRLVRWDQLSPSPLTGLSRKVCVALVSIDRHLNRTTASEYIEMALTVTYEDMQEKLLLRRARKG